MKKIICGLLLIGVSFGIGGCSKVDWHEYSKDIPLLINTQNNGVANAEQDIKIITFNGQVLKDCDINKNDDGSITVILEIADSMANVDK